MKNILHYGLGTFMLMLLSCKSFLLAQTNNEELQMNTKEFNYTKFTSQSTPEITEELVKLTPGEYHSHPEFGILPYDAPCDDCFELLHERKDSSRMFVKKGTNGKHYYSQAVYGLFHYEENGIQISYDPRLKPVSENLYRSDRQGTPAILNVQEKYSAFERNGAHFKFNNKIELTLVKQDGSVQNLGEANWTNHTVGDEGIYITNAWEGIDITISYQLDRIKLNYIIPHPLNYLQDVKELVLTDHLQLPGGYAVSPEHPEDITLLGYIGKYIVKDNQQQEVFSIGRAFGYDQSGIKENSLLLNYMLDGTNLSISIPENWVSSANNVYPLIIDPLVNSTATFTSGWKSFQINGAWCGGTGFCSYTLNVPRPANATIIGTTLSAQYITEACNWLFSCWMNEAAFKVLGPCGISPAGAGVFWSCAASSPGTCTLTNGSIYNETTSCLAPACSGNLSFQIQNSYCYCTAGGNCGANCQWMPNNSWSITVQGRTLETPTPQSLNPNPCTGSVNLSAAPSFGVPGYTYLWNTGASSSSINVNNAGTYSVVVTDACNVQSTQQFTIACPLSISLKDFSVVKAGESVLVKWETLNEYNNDYYTIERMTDDSEKWEELGTKKGSKNSVENIVYKFYDNAPYRRGTSYYRLKQTDYSGEYFYFEPKAINFSEGNEIRIFPQPASNELIVEWNGFDGDIHMYSLLGEKITLPFNKKGISHIFDTSRLSSGVYTIVFSVDGESVSTQKVVIK